MTWVKNKKHIFLWKLETNYEISTNFQENDELFYLQKIIKLNKRYKI